MLHTLLKWILLGISNHVENETRRNGIDRSMLVACQFIIQSTKTSRHVNYKPQENATRHREISIDTVETPLNVGSGIYIHEEIRCRELIDILSNLNISIDYDKLLNIESQLANSILTEINRNDDVFIPKSVSKDLPIYFAIENTDLKIDTLDGRNQLHGTAITVYIKKETSEVLQHISVDSKCKPKRLTMPIYSIQYCPKPIRKNNNYPIYTKYLSSKVMRICRNDNIVWTLMKTLNNDLARNIPVV